MKLFVFIILLVCSRINCFEQDCEIELNLDILTMNQKFGKVLKVKHLGVGPLETINPFLFCAYHRDDYPIGNDKMGVPGIKGNGSDFNPSKPFRMYHGDNIPGFPQHPHRGFETLTVTLEGLIDHTDSKGNAGRYGNGDLQWLTAGKGIVHGENFPLIHPDKPNPLRLFQIWLNLPKKSKMVEPEFVMHWAEDIKTISEEKYEIKIFAGKFGKIKANGSPPVNSWAVNSNNHVSVYFMKLKPGAELIIPKLENVSHEEGKVSRVVYLVEGTEVKICSQLISRKENSPPVLVEVEIEGDTLISTKSEVELLVLQGREIKGERVVQHGPFVMNSEQEIRQAFADYQKTQFGGWPWEQDAVVFPREETRFALFNGEKIRPP